MKPWRRWHQVAFWAGHPAHGAEIGVRQGLFTAFMLKTFGGLHMVAVDLWQPRMPRDEPGYETYQNYDFATIRAEFDDRTRWYRDRLTVLNKDSVAAANDVKDGSLDFVFIDADHSYSSVKADIAAWRPKVRRGGILTGHDYGHVRFPGVRTAVDELGLPVVTGVEATWMIQC